MFVWSLPATLTVLYFALIAGIALAEAILPDLNLVMMVVNGDMLCDSCYALHCAPLAGMLKYTCRGTRGLMNLNLKSRSVLMTSAPLHQRRTCISMLQLRCPLHLQRLPFILSTSQKTFIFSIRRWEKEGVATVRDVIVGVIRRCVSSFSFGYFSIFTPYDCH